MLTTSNLELSRTQRILVILIFSIFTFLVFINFTKEPFVFLDESEIATAAHCLSNSAECGSVPFSARLWAPEKQNYIIHPPGYYWLIAASTRIFGFNIYAIRITSYVVGLITLLFFFFMLRSILKKNSVVILCLSLFAVDHAFIRSSRFGRPDILVVLFTTAAILCYLRTYVKEVPKNLFLFAGILSACAFMTHFGLGIVPLFFIAAHFLIVRRYREYGIKTFLLLVGPTIVLFFIWVVICVIPLLAQPGVTSGLMNMFHYKLTSNSSNLKIAIKAFIGHIGYEQAVFYIYAYLWVPSLLFLKNKPGAKSFLVLINLLIYPYFFLFGTMWYASLLTSFACITFGYLISEENRYKKVIIAFLLLAISGSIAKNVNVAVRRSKHSYEEFSQKMAQHLLLNAKVLIYSSDPDPYFYLAARRSDLRLVYVDWFAIHDRLQIGSPYLNCIDSTDYIITGHLYDIFKKAYSNKTLSGTIFKQDQFSPYEKRLIDEVLERAESYVFFDDIERVVIKLSSKKG